MENWSYGRNVGIFMDYNEHLNKHHWIAFFHSNLLWNLTWVFKGIAVDILLWNLTWWFKGITVDNLLWNLTWVFNGIAVDNFVAEMFLTQKTVLLIK